MSTVIELSRLFVAQVLTAEVRKGLKQFTADMNKADTSLKKWADLAYKNGGRIAHFMAVEGETGEDKATRLAMVAELESSLASGFSKHQFTVWRMTLEEAKNTGQDKERREASKKVGAYKGRFLDHMWALEFPGTERPKQKKTKKTDEEPSKDKTEATGEKSPEQFILEDLVSLRGHAMKCPEGELIDAILTFTAQAIMALGGSIE